MSGSGQFGRRSAGQRDTPAPSGLLRPVSLTNQAYDRLRRMITEDTLHEGSPLVIASLVRAFGISQTPVREALARLNAEGLASFIENVGYRVAARPTEADFEHWLEARLVIEVACARRAATCATPSEIEALAAINAEIHGSELGDDFESVRRFSELNARFHGTLATACRNPLLRRAYDQIWLAAQFSRVHYGRDTIYDQVAAEHDVIVAALVARDPVAAASAMQRHIVDSLTRDRLVADP